MLHASQAAGPSFDSETAEVGDVVCDTMPVVESAETATGLPDIILEGDNCEEACDSGFWL